ncbi:MAG TPA: hypothetical protein VMF31_10575 [Solirubrobacterales bacterium]|nr:hypothetical protein [Solirubrobacterales bacterium]
MAKKLNAATDLFEIVEVDLWGPTYTLRQPTRKIERQMDEVLEQLEGLPADATDEQTLAAIAEVVNVLLEPVPDETGKKTAAKTVLKNKYKDESIGLGHVNQLFNGLMEMRSERPS